MPGITNVHGVARTMNVTKPLMLIWLNILGPGLALSF